MDDDHAARAGEFEKALDWEEAESAWLRALEAGCPDAEEGLARVRKVRTLIEELRRVTAEIIGEEDLDGAVEPLRELSGLVPGGDPDVRAFRIQWRDLRAKALKGVRRAEAVFVIIFFCVCGAASFAFGDPFERDGGGAILGGIAVGLALLVICLRFFPALRPRRLPPRRSIIPERKQMMKEWGTGDGSPRSGRMSRIERWRRDARNE